VLSVDARVTGRDRAALAKLISDAEPDAVCVHAAPHLGRWRNKAGVLARRAGLLVVAAGGRRSGANLLLSTLALDSGATAAIRFSGTGGTNPPGAALALLRTGGQDVVLAAATLGGNSAVRLGQARELQAAIDRLVPGAPPAIISVLGSDRPGTAAWQSMAAGRSTVAGRFFLDEGLSVAKVDELGDSAPAPAALTELAF
jgi:hypothetical protein